MTVEELLKVIEIEEVYDSGKQCTACCSLLGGGKARYEG